MTQRLPRLLLVFWGIVFLGFGTCLGIILFFITVVTRDSGEVFLGLLGSALLEVVLPLIVGVLGLEFLYLRFSF